MIYVSAQSSQMDGWSAEGKAWDERASAENAIAFYVDKYNLLIDTFLNCL